MANFVTRKPTGRPSFPIILLAGVEGSGKTWAAVEATGLPLIDRAFFIEVGERMADEYGAVPGADFEIIEHNGTFNDILAAVRWAGAQEPAEGKANLLIIDSMTEVWTLLQDEVQIIANKRRNARRDANGDAQITMDLWNVAKDRHATLLNAVRAFRGPSILTSRLDNVTLMDGGKPTGEKTWKVKAEKNLPYHAQAVVQARQPRVWTLTKVASTKLQLSPGGEMPIDGFTVGKLLTGMGIDAAADKSTFVAPVADIREECNRLLDARDMDGLGRLWRICNEAGDEEGKQLAAAAGKKCRAILNQQQAGEGRPESQTRQQTDPAGNPLPSDGVAAVGEVIEGELIPLR
ncbi:AAA family ATPase [Corynebacterium ulcerans]|uniref:AAA family ATPase n=1 Tax=Corynebacterium ulcerans TaxID=65058 RepID=UPI000269D2F4|nr:AAA family ATPase [Corynebacterium ulcerans]ESU58827.1 hypothetical protein D881_03010 [Corynebacterium ulcerans NCTC 12077]MBH5301447.1 AAA family ATPase [Corynebacterium ulcerans]BAM26701.1 putative secreted protein [Corynebacterium ulcerans 0102]BBJ71361.1 hypothetical protein CULC0211_04950 [Corynebacterium ulcerans]BBJ73668.1 hypothetical protein CULCFH20161_04950 [Corynebacterium ulcerans]